MTFAYPLFCFLCITVLVTACGGSGSSAPASMAPNGSTTTGDGGSETENNSDGSETGGSSSTNGLENSPISETTSLGTEGQTATWVHTFPGILVVPADIVGNDDLALIRSVEPDGEGGSWLTAINPVTGDVLWRQNQIEVTCAPVITAAGDVLAHLQQTTPLAGENLADDLVLLDGASGAVLDTWEPADADLRHCESGQLMRADNNLLVYSARGHYRGIRITDEKKIEPVWVNKDLDPFSSSEETVVFGNNLFVFQQAETNGVTKLVARRIDAGTGVLVDTVETELTFGTRFQIAGPDHLVIAGITPSNENALSMLTGVNGASQPGSTTTAWTQIYPTEELVVSPILNSDTALSDGSFATWFIDENDDNDSSNDFGISEINLTTGVPRWFYRASALSLNLSVVSLPEGGYVISALDQLMLEAMTAGGEFAWSISAIDSMEVFGNIQVLGGNNIVATLSAPFENRWQVFAISTVR